MLLVLFWCNLLMYPVSSGFSFKPTSSSSSSSLTQFSQEWVCRKVVVKHSIKSNLLNHRLEIFPVSGLWFGIQKFISYWGTELLNLLMLWSTLGIIPWSAIPTVRIDFVKWPIIHKLITLWWAHTEYLLIIYSLDDWCGDNVFVAPAVISQKQSIFPCSNEWLLITSKDTTKNLACTCIFQQILWLFWNFSENAIH